MRNFAKVDPTFWASKQGRALRKHSSLALALAMYLMTTHHANYLGLYALPIGYAASDLGADVNDVIDALKACTDCGFAKFDEENEVVWVVDYATLQVGPSLKPNDLNVKAVKRQFDEVPESPLKQEFLTKYAEAYHLPFDGAAREAATPAAVVAPAAKAPSKALAHPLPVELRYIEEVLPVRSLTVEELDALPVEDFNPEVLPDPDSYVELPLAEEPRRVSQPGLRPENPSVANDCQEQFSTGDVCAAAPAAGLENIENLFMGTCVPVPPNWPLFLAMRHAEEHSITPENSAVLLQRLDGVEPRLLEAVVALATNARDADLSRLRQWRREAFNANPVRRDFDL